MKSKISKVFSLVVFLILVFPIYKVFAATVILSPSSGSYRVGDNIPIRVLVNSSTSVNAVSSKISFTSNLISLSSISKSGSIINIWAQEPNFSNSSGTANLDGVILSGYTGSGGNIATLNFRANSEGQAEIKFLDSSILANDGNGTEVGTGSSSSFITITKAVEKPKEKPKEVERPTTVETVVETTKQAVEKVRVVEETNHLPNYSLVITLLLVVIILLILIIIYGIYYVKKLWIIFKKKILKDSNNVLNNLEVLKKDLDDEIVIADKIRKSETLNSDDISFQIKLEKDINNAEGEIKKEIKELKTEE